MSIPKLKKQDDFHTTNSFSQMIERRAIDSHENSVLDAITSYCEEQFIDVEDVTKYFSKSLLDKIKIEASNRRLIIDQPSKELPFL